MHQSISEYDRITTKLALVSGVASSITQHSLADSQIANDWIQIVGDLIVEMQWPREQWKILDAEYQPKPRDPSNTAIEVRVQFKREPVETIANIAIFGQRSDATIRLTFDRKDPAFKAEGVDLASAHSHARTDIIRNMINEIHNRLIKKAWDVARFAG